MSVVTHLEGGNFVPEAVLSLKVPLYFRTTRDIVYLSKLLIVSRTQQAQFRQGGKIFFDFEIMSFCLLRPLVAMSGRARHEVPNLSRLNLTVTKCDAFFFALLATAAVTETYAASRLRSVTR